MRLPCVRDWSGYPFCLQKDMSGKPDRQGTPKIKYLQTFDRRVLSRIYLIYNI